MQKVDYNTISKIYDDVRQSDLAIVERFIAETSLGGEFKALDIGCGTGNYTDLFQKLTGATVYGVEPSAGMLRQAHQKNDQITFCQGRADAIPFDDCIFDFVFMTDVIHHVPDIDAMFAEIRRILKPSGKLCISTQSHAQIVARPIAAFFPATVRVDQGRYPDIPEILAAARPHAFGFIKDEILFAGQETLLDQNYLELVWKKGYSMLHLISAAEYQAGLTALKTALREGPFYLKAAGETLLWLKKAKKSRS
ncbi:class I SAM-dependent methyltransferase [Chloroflexota bacterium]